MFQDVLEGAIIPPEHDIYSQLVFGQIDLNQRPLPRDISEQVQASVKVNVPAPEGGRDREERDSFDVDVTELTRPLERSQNNVVEVQGNTSSSHTEASPSCNVPDLLSQLAAPGDSQDACKSNEPPKAGFDVLFDLNESLSADDLALQQTETNEAQEAGAKSNANTTADETQVGNTKRLKKCFFFGLTGFETMIGSVGGKNHAKRRTIKSQFMAESK